MRFIEYPGKGISFSVLGKNVNKQTIYIINITKPNSLKTSKGIGIGSSVKSLLKHTNLI